MANSLVINNQTVINANTDFVGRNLNLSGSVTIGNTSISSTSISVQSLVVGSISTSGAGGSSSGFNITGNGSFTGALSAGSISTGGTFSAGNSTFNGTVTLGNISMQNGSITVGTSTLNASGLTSNGIGFGTAASVGYYGDTTNLGLRLPSTNGNIIFQTPGGASNMAIFGPSLATINTGLNVNGTLNVTNGNIALVNGQLSTDYNGNGGLRLLNGGAGQTGYLEFRTANTAANRVAYMGYAPTAGGAINLYAESGYFFNFTGVGGAPQVNGSNIINQSALNSALTNYITSSQLSGYATTSQLSSYAALSGASFSGGVTINNNPLIIGAANPYFDLVYPNVIRARWQVDGSANMIYRNGDSGGNYFYISTSGAVWTAQIGDLNTRIENRAAAYADDRKNSVQQGNRWVYAGDLGNDWNIQSGFQTPYNGAAVVDRRTGFGNSSDQLVQGLRWRYLQLYIPNQGWINSYYAS